MDDHSGTFSFDDFISDESSVGADAEQILQPEPIVALQSDVSNSEKEQAGKIELYDTLDHLNRIINGELAADRQLRDFAIILHGIIEYWQRLAGHKNPNRFPVDFGDGNTATLLQVFALVPEELQVHILVQDPMRYPSADGQNLSWLDEHIMNAIVCLWKFSKDSPVQFGRSLASGVSMTMDSFYQKTQKNSFLKYRLSNWASGASDLDWNPEGQYTFSSTVEKIVHFWNYTESHWTVVTIDLAKDHWTNTLYNSMEGSSQKKGPSWNSAVEHGQHLDILIRAASGIDAPLKPPSWNAGASTQQTNSLDCGAIAIYNAVQILRGLTPSTQVQPATIRYQSLLKILEYLNVREDHDAESEFEYEDNTYACNSIVNPVTNNTAPPIAPPIAPPTVSPIPPPITSVIDQQDEKSGKEETNDPNASVVRICFHTEDLAWFEKMERFRI